MSQEKVDAYKKEKANRKKALQKQKKKAVMYKVIGAVVGVIAVAWIVCSIGWTYLGWTSPFAEKETTKIYSEAEISSMREALGLDAEGNTTTAPSTTANENATTDDSSTTVADENATKDEASTTTADKKDTSEEETTTKAE